MKRNLFFTMLAATLLLAACTKEQGCIDPVATNYNADAEEDDGSCIYEIPEETVLLDCQEFNQSGIEYELVDLGLEIDYRVDCKMPVSCDLKILPGVTIEFTTDAGLKVNESGSLNVVTTSGGAGDEIIFTGVDQAAGAWAGIYMQSVDVKNQLDGCKIEFAGGDAFNSNDDRGGLILYAECKVDIMNTTIVNCENFGINANYGDGDFTFVNNTISGCEMPMFIMAEYGGSISGGEFTGNGIDAVYVDSYAGAGNIDNSQTWTNIGVPYRIEGPGTVQSNSNWEISPGVTIEIESGVEFKITEGNSIKAVGTPDELITFKGVNPGAGAWKRIHFDTTNSLNEIGWAVISGGGENPANSEGSIYLWYESRLNIHDSHFVNNAACGVYGKIFSDNQPNLNYTSSNLTFDNTPCTELFEY